MHNVLHFIALPNTTMNNYTTNINDRSKLDMWSLLPTKILYTAVHVLVRGHYGILDSL